MVKYIKSSSNPDENIVVHWGDKTETYTNSAEALAYWSNMKMNFKIGGNAGLAELADEVCRELNSDVAEVFIYQVDIDEYENQVKHRVR